MPLSHFWRALSYNRLMELQPSRRGLLGLLTVGGAAGQVLTEKDKVEVPKPAPELIGQAAKLARDYIGQYGNCAQATIAGLQDALPFVAKSGIVFLTGSALHGGATSSGNGNCGGFTGAGIVIGHLCGRTRAQMADRTASKLSTALVRQVAAKFEETYGSVICKDVRAKADKKCGDVVAHAAAWAAEALLKQFAKE